MANKDAAAPEKKYRLYTLLCEGPRLVCAPDAGFLLTNRGTGKVHYLEIDRGTSGTRQVACAKTPGYAALAERLGHRRHFPEADLDSFAVLLVAPDVRRRDALKEQVTGKPGAAFWRFAAMPELTPETILTEPVWHRCDGQLVPLIKRGGAA